MVVMNSHYIIKINFSKNMYYIIRHKYIYIVSSAQSKNKVAEHSFLKITLFPLFDKKKHLSIFMREKNIRVLEQNTHYVLDFRGTWRWSKFLLYMVIFSHYRVGICSKSQYYIHWQLLHFWCMQFYPRNQNSVKRKLVISKL